MLNLIKIQSSNFHSSVTEQKRNVFVKKLSERMSRCIFNPKILRAKEWKSDYFKMSRAADETQKHNFITGDTRMVFISSWSPNIWITRYFSFALWTNTWKHILNIISRMCTIWNDMSVLNVSVQIWSQSHKLKFMQWCSKSFIFQASSSIRSLENFIFKIWMRTTSTRETIQSWSTPDLVVVV